MNLKKALKDTCFAVNLRCDTKNGVIEEMIDCLVAAGKVKNKEAALRCVLEREAKMSTGMQSGVAIPHGKTNTVDSLVTAFALKKEGVDFGSQDGRPAKIFVMTISSANLTGPHMEYLAEISKVLHYPSVRERILQANSAEEIIGILTDEKQ